MADTYVATTDINHDGKVVSKRGERVSKGTFDDDQWAQLVEAGSVVLERSKEGFITQAKVAGDAGFGTGEVPADSVAARTEVLAAANEAGAKPTADLEAEKAAKTK